MPDTTTRAREIRAELDKIAPAENDAGNATARQLARYIAAQAQVGWERLWVWPPGSESSEGYLADISLLTTRFAASHALLALADAAPAVADEVARQIVDAWNGGGEVGEWVWGHHGENARQIAELAKELAPLTLPEPITEDQGGADDGRVTVSREDLRAALTAKGPLPDALYDRLAEAAGVTR